MFEVYTFDYIMSQMMQNTPGDIDTREGSLFYNACARQALMLENAYIQMDLILDNMIVETMDEYHLMTYGNERGIIRNQATKAVARGVFNQTIDIGTRFTLNDYNYVVVGDLGSYNYKLECETAGDAANSNIGPIEPIDYVDNWSSGEITEIITPGVKIEDLELYRKRVIESFNVKSFGGNRAEYKELLNALDNVGGCKVTRRKAGEENITIYFQGADYGAPSTETVTQVQNYVDPTVNAGEGYGMAPICHKVKISPVTSTTVNISTKITFDSGFGYQSMKEKIEAAIDDYILELNKSWQDSNAITVRIARIESKILALDGIVDISETKINNAATNLTLDEYAVCKRGVINVV